MKNLLMSTALVLSTATFAAAGSHLQIQAQVDNEMAAMNLNVEIESLTDEQLTAIYTAMTSAETADQKNTAVRSVLTENNVMFEEEADAELVFIVPQTEMRLPRSQLRAKVLAESDDLGISETRIRMLDDDKLTALYLLANSSDPDKMVQAQAIVN